MTCIIPTLLFVEAIHFFLSTSGRVVYLSFLFSSCFFNPPWPTVYTLPAPCSLWLLSHPSIDPFTSTGIVTFRLYANACRWTSSLSTTLWCWMFFCLAYIFFSSSYITHPFSHLLSLFTNWLRRKIQQCDDSFLPILTV
ncbi:hypothetical protein BJV74DRAFT_551825 [Russula compacta]|nr:hypothetical protein BJV74DRAFT_551825 [Russula compacta]